MWTNKAASKMNQISFARRDELEGNIANESCGQSQVRGKLVKLRFIETDSLTLLLLPSDSLKHKGLLEQD